MPTKTKQETQVTPLEHTSLDQWLAPFATGLTAFIVALHAISFFSHRGSRSVASLPTSDTQAKEKEQNLIVPTVASDRDAYPPQV